MSAGVIRWIIAAPRLFVSAEEPVQFVNESTIVYGGKRPLEIILPKLPRPNIAGWWGC